jgi:hypothetical protein
MHPDPILTHNRRKNGKISCFDVLFVLFGALEALLESPPWRLKNKKTKQFLIKINELF